jgi:hypothetical protein
MPLIENRPPEAPWREVGEAGVRDGLMGSTKVTEVGRVGDWSAGKEIRRDRGEAMSLVSGGRVVICREDRGAAGD